MEFITHKKKFEKIEDEMNKQRLRIDKLFFVLEFSGLVPKEQDMNFGYALGYSADKISETAERVKLLYDHLGIEKKRIEEHSIIVPKKKKGRNK